MNGSPGMIFLPSIGSGVVVEIKGEPLPMAAIVTITWGEGKINCVAFRADGSLTRFSSVYPKGHPNAGLETWRWPDEPVLTPLADIGWRS